MTVPFSMQPCKTKLHEIDYPHTWTSFVTLLFWLSPVTDSLLGPVHFPPTEKINALKMHAYKVVEYFILDTKATIVLGDKNTQRFIFFAEMSENSTIAFSDPFETKRG